VQTLLLGDPTDQVIAPLDVFGATAGPSRGCPLLAQLAIMLRTAVPPGLLVGFAGVVARPEQGFAAWQPVAEAVAAVAGGVAADQVLAGGAFQPARQESSGPAGLPQWASVRVFFAG
jgi:hypothetical protein